MQWSALTGEGEIRPPPSDSGETPGTACSTRGRAPGPGWAPGRSCPVSWAACPPCVRGPPWYGVFLCVEEGGRWLPLSWVSAAARAAPASQLPHHTPRQGRFKLCYTPLSSDHYTLSPDPGLQTIARWWNPGKPLSQMSLSVAWCNLSEMIRIKHVELTWSINILHFTWEPGNFLLST